MRKERWFSILTQAFTIEDIRLAMREYPKGFTFTITLLLPIVLCGCGTAQITYQTPNTNEPILLGSKVGIPNISLPTAERFVSKVEGHVGKVSLLSGESKEEDADVAFENLLPDASAAIENGRYTAIANNKSMSRWFMSENPVKIDTSHDFQIESTLYKLAGVSDNLYGIKFGADSSGNGLIFGVTSNGYYKFADYDSSDWHTLIDFKESNAIRQGNQVSNKLTVKRIGNKYLFIVNDSLIDTYEYQRFHGERLGFAISSAQHVAVERITVRDLSTDKVFFDDNFADNRNKWYVTGAGGRCVTNLYFALRHRTLFLILGQGDHITYFGDIHEFSK